MGSASQILFGPRRPARDGASAATDQFRWLLNADSFAESYAMVVAQPELAQRCGEEFIDRVLRALDFPDNDPDPALLQACLADFYARDQSSWPTWQEMRDDLLVGPSALSLYAECEAQDRDEGPYKELFTVLTHRARVLVGAVIKGEDLDPKGRWLLDTHALLHDRDLTSLAKRTRIKLRETLLHPGPENAFGIKDGSDEPMSLELLRRNRDPIDNRDAGNARALWRRADEVMDKLLIEDGIGTASELRKGMLNAAAGIVCDEVAYRTRSATRETDKILAAIKPADRKRLPAQYVPHGELSLPHLSKQAIRRALLPGTEKVMSGELTLWEASELDSRLLADELIAAIAHKKKFGNKKQTRGRRGRGR